MLIYNLKEVTGSTVKSHLHPFASDQLVLAALNPRVTTFQIAQSKIALDNIDQIDFDELASKSDIVTILKHNFSQNDASYLSNEEKTVFILVSAYIQLSKKDALASVPLNKTRLTLASLHIKPDENEDEQVQFWILDLQEEVGRIASQEMDNIKSVITREKDARSVRSRFLVEELARIYQEAHHYNYRKFEDFAMQIIPEN